MPIQWQSCYGGSNHDKATDIVETENGYIIIGNVKSDDGDITNFHGVTDLWVVKIDSLGTIEWERCYGGSSNDSEGRIIADFEGNYYISSWTASNDGDIQSGNHGGYDVWVVKINETGEILWEKCYGGSGTDEPTNLKLLSNGNIMITCSSTSPDGDLPANYGYYDSWIFVLSPNGEIVKNAVFGNVWHNNVLSAIETQDGGYLFASTACLVEGMVEGTYHGGMIDVWVVKIDSSMEIEWQMLYGGSGTDHSSFGLLEVSGGYVFLAQTDSNDGDVTAFHGGYTDIWAVRIDITGNIIWQTCLGGTNYDWGGDLFQTEDNGFVIFGRTHSNNGDVTGNHSWSGYSDIWMVKLSSEGDLEWQQCYGGLNDEEVSLGIIKKSDFNWVIAGSFIYNTGDIDCTWHGLEDYWVFEIKDPSVSIADNQINEQGIKVYPNPAQDYVVFEFKECLTNSEIHIVNVFGQEVTMLPVQQEKIVWDTREIKIGIYYFIIKTPEIVINGKIIISK